MRFNRRQKPPLPKDGQKRTVRRFLWLPLRLGNEMVWLESTYIEQVYKRYAWSEARMMFGDGYWHDNAFVLCPNYYS